MAAGDSCTDCDRHRALLIQYSSGSCPRGPGLWSPQTADAGVQCNGQPTCPLTCRRLRDMTCLHGTVKAPSTTCGPKIKQSHRVIPDNVPASWLLWLHRTLPWIQSTKWSPICRWRLKSLCISSYVSTLLMICLISVVIIPSDARHIRHVHGESRQESPSRHSSPAKAVKVNQSPLPMDSTVLLSF